MDNLPIEKLTLTGEFKVKNIIKKTGAKVFKNFVIGTEFAMEVVIQHAGTSRGRSYSTNILITNLSDTTRICGESCGKSFNELANILKNFEIIQIN